MEQKQTNMVIFVKQVTDPEAPASSFKLDEEKMAMTVASGVPPVLNPDDENALEVALRLKDVRPVHVRVISLGKKLATAVLRKCLAVGADELILLEDETFDNLDSYFIAHALSTAVRKLEPCHLILCGQQASDTNAGIVGLGVAEILRIPSISAAKGVELVDNKVVVSRDTSEGYQVIEAQMPALVTITSRAGALRTPELKQLMDAKNKPITTWRISELGIEMSGLSRPKLVKMRLPPKREGECKIISGETTQIAGENLALELMKAELVTRM